MPTKKATPRKKPARARRPAPPPPPPPSAVGERQNYNLQHEVTDYELWPFSTIEWVADQDKYKARAIIRHRRTGDNVVFNSWHQDFSDAERAIALISDSLAGATERPVYNVFGETIDVHTADHGGGRMVTVIEVQALIWSMRETSRP